MACLLPLGKTEGLNILLYPGIQIFVMVESLLNGISKQYDVVKTRKELSDSVAGKLNHEKNGGEADGT